MFVYVGVAERARPTGSVDCSLVAIDPAVGVVGVHRKLEPTYGERLVWAESDGAGLRIQEHRSVRLSGLNCWKNWMSLARAAMTSIWLGSVPPVTIPTPRASTADPSCCAWASTANGAIPRTPPIDPS